MNKLLCFDTNSLPFCCGINDVGSFCLDEGEDKPTFDKKKPWKYAGYSVKPAWWTKADTENTENDYKYDLEDWKAINNNRAAVEKSGTGLFVATFVDNEDCRAAYKHLCENHTLLFQTNPRINEGTKNAVFLCVFQHERSRKVPKLEPKVTEPTTPRFPIRKGEKLPRL